MEKRIVVDRETREAIAKAFGVSKAYISLSLCFRRDGDTPKRIRRYALLRGGVLMGAKTPECETEYDEGRRLMVQSFGPRVRIEFEKDSGVARLMVDGVEEQRRDGLDVPGLMEMQAEAQRTAVTL